MVEEPSIVDPYASIKLGFTQFDWSDPTIDADAITAKLCGFEAPWAREDGNLSYWYEPEFEGMTPWEVERCILFEGGRGNWAGESKFGKAYYRHLLCLAKLLFPQTFITPALHDIFAFFCFNLGGYNRKGLHLIGSQNAGKSFGSCILAFLVIYIDPAYSNAFIANPKMKTSDSQVWGTIKELWMELCDAHPGTHNGCILFPGAVLYRDKTLDLVPSHIAKGGKIVLQDVKDEGNFRGIKAFGKDVTRGVILLVVDEINMLQSHAFYDMVDNLQSQPAFQALSSQNYTDPESLGGRITEPTGLFGGKDKLDDLDIEEDQYWHSQKSSVTLRLDGHRSPNILANRNIYLKLFTLENRQTLMENGGESSPSYYCQARSFPVHSNENNSVLSRSKISASRHTDPWYTILSVEGSAAFVDPAFGGNDSAVYGSCYWATAAVKDADGNQRNENLIIFDDFFHKVSLVKGATYNDYWIDRLREADIPTSEFTVGSEVSFEEQIAITLKEYCKKRHITSDCVGFDSSMRPDIVSAMTKTFGYAVHAFDYNQGPEGAMLKNLKQNSEDCCKNRNTELAFLAADFFLTKQVRCGAYIETAITQLSRTLYTTVNKKFVSESKPDYKKRWSGKSPDHRDVLVGLCGMAQRKGFRASGIVGGATGLKSAFSAISALNIGKSGIIKRFKSHAMR
jgi:hypothetical protein